jgi:hypothetical protein
LAPSLHRSCWRWYFCSAALLCLDCSVQSFIVHISQRHEDRDLIVRKGTHSEIHR